MKWEYCEHCYIDGHCENQDRGHECELYGKRMKDKCERLQKQLDIAVKAIKAVLHDEFILEHADAGLVMYLTQAEYKIKELNK